jgi:orotidine-5'-phosphate decarboxylase
VATVATVATANMAAAMDQALTVAMDLKKKKMTRFYASALKKVLKVLKVLKNLNFDSRIASDT